MWLKKKKKAQAEDNFLQMLLFLYFLWSVM